MSKHFKNILPTLGKKIKEGHLFIKVVILFMPILGQDALAAALPNNTAVAQPSASTSTTASQPVSAPADADISTVSYDSLRMMAHSGQREQAIVLARAYLEQRGENADIRVLLGNMLLWDGKYDEARQQFQTVLKRRGGYYDASQGLITVEMKTKHYQAALNAVNAALKDRPQDQDLLKSKQNILAALSGKTSDKSTPTTTTPTSETTPASTSTTTAPAAATTSTTSTETKTTESTTTATTSKTETSSTSKTTSKNTITYEQIRRMAYSGKSEQAIPLAEEYLKNSDNSDVRILLARMLAWDKRFPEATAHINHVFKDNPQNGDAIGVMVDIYIWTDQYQAALAEINKGLEYHPNDKYLQERKVQVLAKIATPAESALSSGPALYQYLASRELSKEEKNAIGFNYNTSHISDLDEYWRETSIFYKRYTPYGSIIARVNRGFRFEDYATQYEIDAYPRLWDGAYLYLNYGHSPGDTFYPDNRYGYEGFFSLPKSWEFSAGGRILQFGDSKTYIYTGSLGKYVGNYFLVYRPYITDSVSHHIMIRRYFSNADTYISLRGSYGSGSGTNLTGINNFDDNDSPILSKSIGLSGQYPLLENLLLDWGVFYGVEHYPNSHRYQPEAEIGLTWRF